MAGDNFSEDFDSELIGWNSGDGFLVLLYWALFLLNVSFLSHTARVLGFGLLFFLLLAPTLFVGFRLFRAQESLENLKRLYAWAEQKR